MRVTTAFNRVLNLPGALSGVGVVHQLRDRDRATPARSSAVAAGRPAQRRLRRPRRLAGPAHGQDQRGPWTDPTVHDLPGPTPRHHLGRRSHRRRPRRRGAPDTARPGTAQPPAMAAHRGRAWPAPLAPGGHQRQDPAHPTPRLRPPQPRLGHLHDLPVSRRSTCVAAGPRSRFRGRGHRRRRQRAAASSRSARVSSACSVMPSVAKACAPPSWRSMTHSA